jgi:Domain of unknown function (DUF4832)
LVTGSSVWLAALATCILPVHGRNPVRTFGEISKVQSGSGVPDSAPSRSSSASPCETAGKEEITIACSYTPTPHSASKDINTPRIVLNRIMISFEPNAESHMVVQLTFTNEETARISDARTSYLAIDDDAGQNHVRRVLQRVDFRKLAPGQRLTFSDRLLVGSFRPGHYTIYLWIPNPDPALKFNPARNFLLSSLGVADTVTGLNTLARFSVVQ